MDDTVTLTRTAAKTLLDVCASLPPLPKAADKIAVGQAQLELERVLEAGAAADASGVARITDLT